MVASASRRSPDAKFFSALPKNTGVRWPSANACGRTACRRRGRDRVRPRWRKRPSRSFSAASSGNRHFAQGAGGAGIALEQTHAAGFYVDGADEIAAAADRPRHRCGIEREGLLDLVEQLERVAAFTIHLVDESDDRNIAQPAHLEQFSGARLDCPWRRRSPSRRNRPPSACDRCLRRSLRGPAYRAG